MVGEGLSGNDWTFDKNKDVDWRGTGATHLDAVKEAARRLGAPLEEFHPEKFGKTPEGKTVPVVWTHPTAGSINMDIPVFNNINKKMPGGLGNGPHQPHVGYKAAKANKSKGRGHIFVDVIPATR